MSIEADAIYENGTLKLDHPLPLEEHQRVRVVIDPKISAARQSYGIIGWDGDVDILRKVALRPEHGAQESP